MDNSFIHVELNSHDVAASKKFYKSLFKWKLADQKMGPMTYTTIDVGKGVGGGMMKHPMPEGPPFWLSYVLVDDVKKSMAKAKALGAKVIVEYHDVGMGKLGIFADPSGAALGLWQPANMAPAKKAAKKPAKKSKAKKRR